MDSFSTLTAVVAPLNRANIDTDAIIPKQFMKSIRRTGFGDNLFDEWRYLDRGDPGKDVSLRSKNPDFCLNQPQYAGSQILLTQANFGCGSSREHAPWALRDFGIRALIAPSFADIFYGNCFKNGMLPICLSDAEIEELFERVKAVPGLRLHIDLAAQKVTPEGGSALGFEVDSDRKHRLLHGLDDISLTLNRADRIRRYEMQRKAQEPWLFSVR